MRGGGQPWAAVSPAARGGSAPGCRARTRLRPCCAAGRVSSVCGGGGGGGVCAWCVTGFPLRGGAGCRSTVVRRVTPGSGWRESPEGAPRGVGGAGDTRRCPKLRVPACARGPGGEGAARQVRPPARPSSLRRSPPWCPPPPPQPRSHSSPSRPGGGGGGSGGGGGPRVRPAPLSAAPAAAARPHRPYQPPPAGGAASSGGTS